MDLFVLNTWLQARSAADERGASMVEYGLLLALIAIIALVAVKAFGTGVSHQVLVEQQPEHQRLTGRRNRPPPGELGDGPEGLFLGGAGPVGVAAGGGPWSAQDHEQQLAPGGVDDAGVVGPVLAVAGLVGDGGARRQPRAAGR